MKQLCVLAALFTAGCLGVDTIDVQPAELMFISVDQNEQLKPIPKDGSGVLVAGAIRELKWSSTDPKVATVNEVGLVKIVGYGEAEIQVSAGGKTGATKVHVLKPSKVAITPDKIELIDANQTKQLSAKVFDDKGVEIATKMIAWSSSDKDKASVESGLVRSQNAGQVKIFAKCGEATGEAQLTVKYPRVAKLLIDPTVELEVGEQMAIPVTAVGPGDAPLTLIPVKFKSSKPKIAKVDQNGVLTAVSKGRTSVLATAGGLKVNVTVVVY